MESEQGRGWGSLLLGAPKPRGDGADGESLLRLLGELGQTLLLLLTEKTESELFQVKPETGAFDFSSYLRQLSLSPLEGLDGVFLQRVVLQHRTHVVHAAHSDG